MEDFSDLANIDDDVMVCQTKVARRGPRLKPQLRNVADLG